MKDTPAEDTGNLKEARMIIAAAWVGSAINIGVAFYLQSPVLWIGAAAAIFAFVGTLMQRGAPVVARIGAAQALLGQAVVMNAAMAGHAWQIDAHMLYFALLAITVSLNDIRAVLAATALVALHHLTLTFLMPALVFPSATIAENIPRTAMHAVILLLETGALIYALRKQHQLDHAMRAQNEALEEANEKAKQSTDDALRSLADAEEAKKQAQHSRSEAEAALKRAESEAERAAAAHRDAREAAQVAAEIRQKVADRQRVVVDTLRSSLKLLRERNLHAQIRNKLDPQYDDLREDFNQAVEALRLAIETVQSSAQSIGSEVQAMANAAQDMSNRTERQAATLAEISTNVSRFSATVKDTAKSAREAESEAGETKRQVLASGDLVQRAVTAMGEIETSSKEIQKIVGVIDEIAFQTNLLALNAGVEAARAGESGRGFAVVASEVRNLAQRSSDAAQEIKNLISASDSRVGEGVGLVRETGKANESVMSAVNGIVQRIIDIAAGADRQSGALNDISEAIAQLDNVTQRNAAMFEETSAASESMMDGTRKLTEVISAFVLKPSSQAVQSGDRSAA